MNRQDSTAKQVAFLFDLDGVLIDSEREYTKIWERIDELFPTSVSSFAIKIKGMSLTEILCQYYPEKNIADKVRSTLTELESKMHYEWLPGAKELLEYLNNHSIPTALFTSSNKKKMAHLREELPEVENFFNEIVTGDMVTHSKPDPEGYILAAELLNSSPRNCVVFEDSLQGVKAGRAADAYVIGVEGTLKRDIIAPYSNKVINNLSEINPADLIEILKNR